MIDWLTIKSEYINSRISTRELAKKHGVSYSTLSSRAASEGWAAERSKTEAEVWQKTAEAAKSTRADRMLLVIQMGERVVDMACKKLDEMNASGKINVYEIKAITEVLKNVRDLYKNAGAEKDDKLQKIRNLLADVPDMLD